MYHFIYSNKDSYVDEFRISNVARYTANFTPATSAFVTDANTQLLLHLDGANDGTVFTDSSDWGGARHSITANGGVKNERISSNSSSANGDAHIIGPKVGASAITFDGTGDYLSIGDSADFDFGTGTNFTLECWMNAGTQPNSVPALVGNASGYSSGSITFRFNGNNIGYYSYDGNGGTDMLLSSSTMNDNAWHHIAVVRITATWYMYVDGILEDTWTGTNPATDFSFGNTLYIGQNGWDGSNGQYKGYIDELRLSNVARYTANFTPATTEFSSDANTKLLIHSNAAMGSTTFTDSSSGTHAISANGNVKHIAPKIGTGMAVIDSVGDSIQVGVPMYQPVGTTWTLEGWFFFLNDPATSALNLEMGSIDVTGSNDKQTNKFCVQSNGTNYGSLRFISR